MPNLRNPKRRAAHFANVARKAAISIPADFPVRPLADGQPATDRVTCGECGRSWDDAIVTAWTPAPSGRCPFEYFHHERN